MANKPLLYTIAALIGTGSLASYVALAALFPGAAPIDTTDLSAESDDTALDATDASADSAANEMMTSADDECPYTDPQECVTEAANNAESSTESNRAERDAEEARRATEAATAEDATAPTGDTAIEGASNAEGALADETN